MIHNLKYYLSHIIEIKNVYIEYEIINYLKVYL